MTNIDGGLPYSRDAVRALETGPVKSNVELNVFAARAAAQFSADVISPKMLCGLWRLAELAIVAAVGLMTATQDASLGARSLDGDLLIGALGTLVCVAALHMAGGYRIQTLRRRGRQLPRILVALGGAFLSLAVVLVLFSPETAIAHGPWLASWFVGAFAALAIGRVVLSAKISRWARNGFLEQRAVIVGGGSGAEALIRGLELQTDSHIRICGIFDDRGDRRSPPIVAGYPKLGTVRELVEFARVARIDMLIVTLPLTAEQRLLSLMKELWVLPLDIRLSAQTSQVRFQSRSYSFIGQIPLLDVFDRPLDEWDSVAKRVFDLVFASIALVLLLPVLIGAAIAVKLDSKGPIFFRQKRHGFNNQTIGVFKFRSMYHEMADPTARQVVTRGDPRVTRVGRFIRKTSIDELPQLWNVLRGELSLVGPRPHAVSAVSSQNEAFVEIVDGYFGRHKVKPGITGLAQIKGFRGEIDQPDKLKKRVEYDLDYIENWSILFDLYILASTPLSLFKTEHAY